MALVRCRILAEEMSAVDSDGYTCGLQEGAMKVVGCFGLGKWALPAFVVGLALQPAMGAAQTASTRSDRPVTFTKDVAPIMNRSCVRCHRPDEIAPMSLLTYADARPWARSIKERVSKREMPPWFLDKTIGIQKYKEDPSLTDEEIATIVKWVDSGAPQGNPADAPAPPKSEDVSTW